MAETYRNLNIKGLLKEAEWTKADSQKSPGKAPKHRLLAFIEDLRGIGRTHPDLERVSNFTPHSEQSSLKRNPKNALLNILSRFWMKRESKLPEQLTRLSDFPENKKS